MVGAVIRLTLRQRRARLGALLAFSAVFLFAALTARVLTGGEHGHVEMDPLFEIGGYPLVSGLLLLGWVLGRFPLVAVLVLMAGVFSEDRERGYARLYFARPVSPLLLYGTRVVTLLATAFLLSAALLPLFDIILLGQWAGPVTFFVIAAQVLAFGALTALFSLWTRADAWLALFFTLLAMVWDGLRRGGLLSTAPAPLREAFSVLLPPVGALARIEASFGALQPMPWDAFLYIVLYAALALILAGAAFTRQDV